MNYQYGCTVNAEGKKEILKEILSSAALALVLVAGLALLPARASAQGPMLPKSDLKVQIVIQTSPNVYAPVNVPPGTVVSVPPSFPPSIINCPTDCSEIGLASNTNIKLVAPYFGVPNAHFYQWTDIPGSGGLPISNSCTPSSSSSPPPNITCTMAGSRFIQAVYKCNDAYSYDSHSQQCKKPGGPTACLKHPHNVTDCRLGLQIKRANKGPNTYTVTVSPSAITPSVNTAPSTASSCVNTGGALVPQTNCLFYYNSYPTSVTLTATSSPGSLPISFSWGLSCSGSGACTVTVTQVPVNVTANFPY